MFVENVLKLDIGNLRVNSQLADGRALLFCADSNAAVFKGTLDPNPALLGNC